MGENGQTVEKESSAALESTCVHYIRKIREGSAEALALLYDETSPVLYAFAVRVLGNSADAEEVLLDVFQQVWKKAATFDPARGTVWAWLVVLTRSRALDRLRDSAGQRRHEVASVVERAALRSTDLAPDQASILAQRRACVRKALTALPGEQREPLELAFFAGLTHIEIAQKLNIPLGTIKSRIRLAMDRLRVALQPAIDESSRS